MRNSYIIEVGDDAVGVVVKEKGQYHFVAAHRDVWKLDGNTYKTPTEARLAAKEALSGRRGTRQVMAVA